MKQRLRSRPNYTPPTTSTRLAMFPSLEPVKAGIYRLRAAKRTDRSLPAPCLLDASCRRSTTEMEPAAGRVGDTAACASCRPARRCDALGLADRKSAMEHRIEEGDAARLLSASRCCIS